MIEVEFDWLKVGHCQHLECIAARGGKMGKIEFPALCGLIKHPVHGFTLFDTGYSEHFFEATGQLPEAMYRWALPVTLAPEQTLIAQLKAKGLAASDVQTVVVSHYHGDHIAGLKDFPNAKFIASKTDSEAMQALIKGRLARVKATMHGHLPALLPNNYWQQVVFADSLPGVNLPAWMQPFDRGFDVFGDGSCIIVPLPGHSRGQLGLLLPNVKNRGPVFMVADSCWSMPACKEGRLPLPVANFIQDDTRQYRQTFTDLQTLANREPDVQCLPSHCIQTFQAWHDLQES